jgi:uncharacterized protein (TIGR00255 family)
MLHSMTGHGDATQSDATLSVAVEIRSVNHRHFKLNLRVPDGCGSWEAGVESLLRQDVVRGAIHATISLQHATQESSSIDKQQLSRYFDQVREALGDTVPSLPELLPALLSLPDVVTEQSSLANPDSTWPLAESCLLAAMEKLSQMKQLEGNAMAVDMSANLGKMTELLEQITARTPAVTENHRERLTQRIRLLLEPHKIELNPADLIREVTIFADRSDISEEVVRSQSHIAQFNIVMDEPASNGRALDFLAQEMFREANTIGSKANDSKIGIAVIELKTCIERIREMVQNIQ